MTFTQVQLKAIAPTMNQQRLDTFTGPINNAMARYNISDPIVVAMFIAQVMHESCACLYTTELASGQAYEGRKDLGNLEPGDGVLYKGRGLIQVTGKINYLSIMMDLGIDCVVNPQLLAQPDNAALTAGWFWNKNSLSTLAAPGTEAAFESVTRKINGGLNGLADRQAYWTKAKNTLGI